MLNIENLNKLITHLEAQPPERFNMRSFFIQGDRVIDWMEDRSVMHDCGTAACIAGHVFIINPDMIVAARAAAEWIGLDPVTRGQLFEPEGFRFTKRWPLWRAIATLKRLRDQFLATGEVVVDWGSEPTEGQPWSPPHATEIREPELPEALTRLLGAPADVVTVEG